MLQDVYDTAEYDDPRSTRNQFQIWFDFQQCFFGNDAVFLFLDGFAIVILGKSFY
jgi:hypothetical protein